MASASPVAFETFSMSRLPIVCLASKACNLACNVFPMDYSIRRKRQPTTLELMKRKLVQELDAGACAWRWLACGTDVEAAP